MFCMSQQNRREGVQAPRRRQPVAGAESAHWEGAGRGGVTTGLHPGDGRVGLGPPCVTAHGRRTRGCWFETSRPRRGPVFTRRWCPRPTPGTAAESSLENGCFLLVPREFKRWAQFVTPSTAGPAAALSHFPLDGQTAAARTEAGRQAVISRGQTQGAVKPHAGGRPAGQRGQPVGGGGGGSWRPGCPPRQGLHSIRDTGAPRSPRAGLCRAGTSWQPAVCRSRWAAVLGEAALGAHGPSDLTTGYLNLETLKTAGESRSFQALKRKRAPGSGPRGGKRRGEGVRGRGEDGEASLPEAPWPLAGRDRRAGPSLPLRGPAGIRMSSSCRQDRRSDTQPWATAGLLGHSLPSSAHHPTVRPLPRGRAGFEARRCLSLSTLLCLGV